MSLNNSKEHLKRECNFTTNFILRGIDYMADEEKNEEELKEKTKKLSMKEGSAYSVMDGFGLRYMTPYVLALGASNAQIGFLTSIPSLLGNFFQMFSSRVIEKYSRKKILLFGILFQLLMWIPIIIIGFFFFYKGLSSGISSDLVILIYSILLVFGTFVSPAWNSLIRDIVTKNSGAYFGRRNRIIGFVALISMLIGGFILDYFKQTKLFLGFCILFGLAFIARAISLYLLTKHYEPELKLQKGYYFSFKQFITRAPSNNFGKFAIFVGLMMFATAIASPFFSVYMLKELEFSYLQWILVTISSSLASLLFMPLWGKFADKYGNLKVIQITGALVPLVPLLWLASPIIAKISLTILIFYLILIEFFSGFVWSGFNLSTSNFMFDAITRERFPLCVSYFNLLNGVGIFLGATLGGIISSMNFTVGIFSSLLFVFFLSWIFRFIVYVVMVSKIKEVRLIEEYHKGDAKKEIGEGLIKELTTGFYNAVYLPYKLIKPIKKIKFNFLLNP